MITTSNAPNKSRRGRPKKPEPLAVFEQNIADAKQLIVLSETLRNERKRQMRQERREAISNAVRTTKRGRKLLDIAENDEVLIVFKPGARCCRTDLEEAALRPLLRQAMVAIAAAVESYVAEKACGYVTGELLLSKSPPKGLREIPLTMGELIKIEREYQRRGYGRRKVVVDHVRLLASANPDSIGKVFSAVGKEHVLSKVDVHRTVKSGESKTQLDALVQRRNRVAHTGDRAGSGKAAITPGEVRAHYDNAKSIVEALEAVLG